MALSVQEHLICPGSPYSLAASPRFLWVSHFLYLFSAFSGDVYGLALPRDCSFHKLCESRGRNSSFQFKTGPGGNGNCCSHCGEQQVCVCELLSRVRLFATAMDFSLLGFSVQTRILEWVAISFSRGSSRPGDRTGISCIAGQFFINWAMREAQNQL